MLAESLARLGARVTAIDPSKENVQIATQHSATDSLTKGINYVHTSVEELAESGKQFDVVCSLEVIEHVDNPLAFIESCGRCVRPGGSLFLSTLNRSPKAYAFAILGAEHLSRMVPVGTHDWNKFITPEEMEKMVSATPTSSSSSSSSSRFQVQELAGIVFVPELRGVSPSLLESWKISSRDLDVNYIMHATKPPAGAGAGAGASEVGR